ncbi:MAG: hypothetical protein F6K10_01890 [Moorea sp. SIO2B7]|nr:hypothetical protein [Moorena sp. SIO2B7]
MNQGRIDQKKTAETKKIKERAKLFSNFKGTKYIWLKREEKLKEKQKQKLDSLKIVPWTQNCLQLVGVVHLNSDFS